MEWCGKKEQVIVNFFFKHHPRRLWTWRSPGAQYKNQIDYYIPTKLYLGLSKRCCLLFSLHSQPHFLPLHIQVLSLEFYVSATLLVSSLSVSHGVCRFRLPPTIFTPSSSATVFTIFSKSSQFRISLLLFSSRSLTLFLL